MTMLAEAPVAPVAEPKVGEVRDGAEIGKCRGQYQWAGCLDCGKQRWVLVIGGQVRNERCQSCGRIYQESVHRTMRAISPQGGTTTAPVAGDIRMGQEIDMAKGNKFIWLECPDCHKPRWVYVKDRRAGGIPLSIRCRHCANGQRHGSPQTRWVTKAGYIAMRIDCDSPYFLMAKHFNKGRLSAYVFEHRLVMAQHLGRCLYDWENVHHKNGHRDDNRIENLQIVLGPGMHNGIVTCPYCHKEFGLR